MARRKQHDEFDDIELPPPAKTLEGREDQLIALSYELAEKRMRTNTASAQEVVHFLRQGSVRAQLEKAKIEHENLVLQARVEEMKSHRSQEELLERALAAFKGYSGQDEVLHPEDFDDPELY